MNDEYIDQLESLLQEYGISLPGDVGVLNIPDEPREAVRTGLFSLDWLLGYRRKHGILRGTFMELYGTEGVGKTTLAYYLLGKPVPTGKAYIADLEGSGEFKHVQQNAARSGFNGTVEFMQRERKKKKLSHAQIVTDLADMLLKEDTSAIVMDSVGAYQPAAEAQLDDVTDTVWGRRAQELAKLSRRISDNLGTHRNAWAFVINHQLPEMSSTYGHSTPGGKTLKYMVDYRLWMRRKETVLERCFWVKMNTEKKRFGGNVKDMFGYVFIIPEFGVSPEMTAVFDCFELGLANRPMGSALVTVGDTSTARLRDLIEKAQYGSDPEIFHPFYRALINYEKETL